MCVCARGAGGLCRGEVVFTPFLRENVGKDLGYCGVFHLYKNKTKDQILLTDLMEKENMNHSFRASFACAVACC